MIFCGAVLKRYHDVDSLSSLSGEASIGSLSHANPRVHRIMHREGFARALNERPWASPAPGSSSTSTGSNSNAAGPGESLTSSLLGSGGSLAFIAQTATKPPRHHHHQYNGSRIDVCPLVRIHEVDGDGALVTKHPLISPGIGAVWCGTILPSAPNIVYLDHEGACVSVWVPWVPETRRTTTSSCSSPQQYFLSLTSISTNFYLDDKALIHEETLAGELANAQPVTGPDSLKTPDSTALVWLRSIKISFSDVTFLEGVGSRLWAGTCEGLIYAYDVSGGAKSDGNATGDADMEKNSPATTKWKPWVVTSMWKAQGDLPVLRIVVDPLGQRIHRSCVCSSQLAFRLFIPGSFHLRRLTTLSLFFD